LHTRMLGIFGDRATQTSEKWADSGWVLVSCNFLIDITLIPSPLAEEG
jgi:hypothetical protein